MVCFSQSKYIVMWESGTVVKTVGERGFEPHSAFKFQRYNMFLPRSLINIQYCGEARGSVLCLIPPWLEFRILCLQGCVIHSSHYPQEVVLVQFSLYVHKGVLKPHSFHFMWYFERSGALLIYPVNRWSQTTKNCLLEKKTTHSCCCVPWLYLPVV